MDASWTVSIGATCAVNDFLTDASNCRSGEPQCIAQAASASGGPVSPQLLFDDGHDLTKPFLSLARPTLGRVGSCRLGCDARFGPFRTFLCGSYVSASPLRNDLKSGLQIANPLV
jgi:hypothetical protein